MVSFSSKSLKKFIGDFEDVHLDTWNSNDIEVPFQIKPSEFLKFAETDLNNKYAHRLVNSLSNIKRAIDCQLDSLLYGFGLFEKSNEERWNFPRKIETLKKLGIISPRILKKINQKRNLLEHQYIKPKKSEVDDALDVATLFIAYTEKFLIKALIECEPVDDKTGDSFKIIFDYKNGKLDFGVTMYDKQERYKGIKKAKSVTSDSKEYMEYLKWFINLYKLRR